MLRFFKSFFGKKEAATPVAPYKVETPAPVAPAAPEPAKCGCGRSPTGLCVGHHKLSETEWAAHADNPVKPVAEVETKPKQAPAKKAPAKKPAAMKAPAKPKAPRKPKAK